MDPGSSGYWLVVLMLVLLWGCYFFLFFICWWLLGCMWWWVDGWVLILGRWVGSGGWLGLDEIGGWVGSGRRSGGRIIFGFATVGLHFACCRFAAVDLGFARRGSRLARLGFFFFGWVLLIHDLLQTPLTLCLFLFYFYTLIYFYHFCPKKKMQDILLDWLINRVSKTQFLGWRHMKKTLYQTWLEHWNWVSKTWFMGPKSSLLNLRC